MRPAGIPKSSGILPRRIFVFPWVFHKLVRTVLTSFGKGMSLPDPRPLPDPSCACSDTNGLRHKAHHQHMGLVLTHNLGIFNVIFNYVVNSLQHKAQLVSLLAPD